MSENLGEVVLTLKTDNTGLDSGLLAAKTNVEGISGVMSSLFGSQVGGAISNLGTMLMGPLGLVAGIGAIGAAALNAGMEFDAGMDKIRIQTGATGDQLTALGENMRNVFTSVPTSTEDASAAIGMLSTRLGLTETDLEAVSTQVLNLTRMTGTDLSSNLNSITRLFGDWSVSTDKQAGAMDLVFRASQATGTSFGTLSDLMTQFGGPLRQLGFSFEESAALIGKFESEGVNTNLVLGSMRIALGKMADKDVKDIPGAFDAIVTQIKAVGTAGEANKLAAEAFGKKAGPDMASAIREGRFELDPLLAKLTEGKDTIDDAAKATDDFGETWKLLKNNLTALLEPLGTFLIGMLNNVMTGLTAIFDGVTGASGVWTAVADIAKTAYDAIVSGWSGFVDAVAGPLAELWTTLQEFWATIGPPLLTAMEQVWINIKLAVGVAWDLIAGVIGLAWDSIKVVINTALESISGIIKVFHGLITLDFEKVGEGLKQIVSGIWNGIVEIYDAQMKAVDTIVKGWWEKVVDWFRDSYNNFSAALARVGIDIGTLITVSYKPADDAVASLDTKHKALTKSLTDGVKPMGDHATATATAGATAKTLSDEQEKANKAFADSLTPMENLKTKLDALVTSGGFSKTDVIIKYADEIKNATTEQTAMGTALSPQAKLMSDLADAHLYATGKIKPNIDIIAGLSSNLKTNTTEICNNFTASASTYLQTQTYLDEAVTDMTNYQNSNKESAESIMDDFQGILGGIIANDEATNTFIKDQEAASAKLMSFGTMAKDTWKGWVDELKSSPLVTTMDGVTRGIKNSLGDMATSAKNSMVDMFQQGDFSGQSFKNMLGGMAEAFNPLQIGMNLAMTGLASLGKAIGGLITGPNSWEALSKELQRDYGIKASDQAIMKFAESLGISESRMWGMRSNFEASPIFLAQFSGAIAETNGQMEPFLQRLTSIMGVNLRPAFEVGQITGDWTDLNALFLDIYGDMGGLSERLLMQNTEVKDVGKAMNYFWGELVKTGEVSDSLRGFIKRNSDALAELAETTEDAHQKDLLLLTDLDSFYKELTDSGQATEDFLAYMASHKTAIEELSGKYPTLTTEINKANVAMAGAATIDGLNSLRGELSELQRLLNENVLPEVMSWQQEFVDTGVITDTMRAKVAEAGGELQNFQAYADMRQTMTQFEDLVAKFEETGRATGELQDLMEAYGVSINFESEKAKSQFNSLADTVRGNMKASLVEAAGSVSSELSAMDNLIVRSIQAMTDAIVAAINGLGARITAPLSQVQNQIDTISQPVTIPVAVVTTYSSVANPEPGGGGGEPAGGGGEPAWGGGTPMTDMINNLVANGYPPEYAASLAVGSFGLTLDQVYALYGSYAAGTPWVPRTGPYWLHEGERVVPADQNKAGVGSGLNYIDNSIYNLTAPPGEDPQVFYSNLQRIIETNYGNIRRLLQEASRAGI